MSDGSVVDTGSIGVKGNVPDGGVVVAAGVIEERSS